MRKWNALWSAGVGWILSKENFYKVSVFPYLKFRVTYGFNGNADPNKAAVTTISYRASLSPYSQTPNALVEQYANPELRWEKVRLLNLGLDFESQKKRIAGSIEFYHKKGIDLFGFSPIDYTTGVGNIITRNVANIKAKGVDIELNTINVNRRFKWYSTFIFNFNSDQVTKYYKSSNRGSLLISSPNSLVISAFEGKPIYSIFSYKWAGLNPVNGNPQGL